MRQGTIRDGAIHIDMIRALLPSNYGAFTWSGDVVITGVDSGGLTMEDYIVPTISNLSRKISSTPPLVVTDIV